MYKCFTKYFYKARVLRECYRTTWYDSAQTSDELKYF